MSVLDIPAQGAAIDETPWVVTEESVYPDMPESVYHADPVPHGSLSSSGARRILPPSCPAVFRWWADNEQEPRTALELGTAAHRRVLGVGAEIHVVDAEDWSLKRSREERDEARAAGKTPLLRPQNEQTRAMADVIRCHPIASALFDPDNGAPEQSLFWRDPATGVMCRARLDWLPQVGPDRLIVPDYKTTISADPAAIAKTVAKYGYHQQDAFYTSGVKHLGLADDVVFVFVFQEKTAPYLVSVVQLDPAARRYGADLNRRAVDTFARCTADDDWPAYLGDVATISLPRWAFLADRL